MSPSPTVAVLLATYNGEEYLEALLDSVLAQTHAALTIHVRDDASTDRTREILAAYKDPRVVITHDDRGRLRSAGSFLQLLSTVRADIYMFCDQDDIWQPTKVADAVAMIASHGGHTMPILMHTDLVVVDARLNVLKESFHASEGIELPAAHALRRLVVQNCVVGCTTAFTEALVARSGLREATPSGAAMHDWWLALCAACFGTLVYSPAAPILYRQHDRNVSGARRRSFAARIRRQLSFEGTVAINAYRLKVARQAESFLEFYGAELPESARRYLTATARLKSGSGLAGIARCARQGIRLQSGMMNVALIYSAFAGLLRRSKAAE